MIKRDFALLTDFYELTMANGYFVSNKKDEICIFDVFFRDIPDDGGFAICCGLTQVIEYVKNLKFTTEDIDYLKSKNCFSSDFINYLKEFKFEGDIYAVEEGTPIFPNEPILIVKAKAIEAQLLETFVLLTLNHQSLIATKSNRIVRAAQKRVVSEFGARRAQGPDAAVLGARASYIAGVNGTSCTLTDKYYKVPATGTMAHSWVQMFDSEYEAFLEYCKINPDNATLLVDTYNILKSGVPNAIRVFKELNITKCAIRLDSGDLTYLTRKARKMLDDAGLKDCKIIVSNALDELLIRDLIYQGACIDGFGVGERLITARSEPVFGGVYKLVAVEKNNEIIPKIKISENVQKITTPHFKKVYRLFDNESNKAIADLIAIHDEEFDFNEDIEIFDPNNIWKKKMVTNYSVKSLLVPIFIKGELVYKDKTIEEKRKYCLEEIDKLWEEVKRFENPHRYYVDLSKNLWELKQKMLERRYN